MILKNRVRVMPYNRAYRGSVLEEEREEERKERGTETGDKNGRRGRVVGGGKACLL